MPFHSLIALALLALAPAACAMSSATAEPDAGVPVPPAAAPTVRGQDSTFEIATWNLEHFPKASEATVERVVDIVQRLQLDAFAVQELNDTDAFDAMVASMPGWRSLTAGTFTPADGADRYNPPVGFMYNSSSVVVQDHYLLFPEDSEPFPRSPLAVDIEWHGVPLTIVSLHLKALGDDIISADATDEEARRKLACDMLAEHLNDSFAGRRVIVLGDWNDRLGEPPSTDVFQAFHAEPERFYFVDTELAERGGYDDVSYPPYTSHIDHILITSELFPGFFTEGSDVQTLTVEGFLEYGWYEYDALVSDHRPVYARFVLDSPAPAALWRDPPARGSIQLCSGCTHVYE